METSNGGTNNKQYLLICDHQQQPFNLILTHLYSAQMKVVITSLTISIDRLTQLRSRVPSQLLIPITGLIGGCSLVD